MDFKSKDALQNLILLVVFGVIGLAVFSSVLLGILSYFHGSTNAISVLQKNPNLFNSISKNEILIYQLFSQVCYLILPAFFLMKIKPTTRQDFSNFKINWTFLAHSILLLLYTLPVINFLNYLNEHLPLSDWMHNKENNIEELLKKILNMQSFGDFIFCLIAVAIIPAIAEEWVFRGIIQTQIIRMVDHKMIGLLITAFIFSAIHMQFEGFFARLAAGLILGIVYLYGKNLIYNTALHFLFNGTQVILVYVMGIDAMNNKTEIVENWKILFFSCVISIPFIYYALNKLRQHSKLQYA